MTVIRRARTRFRRTLRHFDAAATPPRARAADRTLLDALERPGPAADRVIDRLLAAIEAAPPTPAR
jgi:hypothetical protein